VNTLRAEWTKLRTVAGPAWLLIAAAALTVAVGALTASAMTCRFPVCAADAPKLSLTGVQLAQAVVAVLGVLAVGGEYGTGMITTTLAAMPRRGAMLAAKAATLTVPVLVAGAAGAAGSLLVGGWILPGHGYPGVSVLDGATLRAGLGSALYLALVALLSLGIATALRNSAAAIGVVLGLLYMFPILIGAVSDPRWERRLRQLGPGNAGQAIQTTVDLPSLPIGPWQGLGVMAAWAAGALLVGWLVLRLRDA
jgi:ABC-2 type transport system permease protein